MGISSEQYLVFKQVAFWSCLAIWGRGEARTRTLDPGPNLHIDKTKVKAFCMRLTPAAALESLFTQFLEISSYNWRSHATSLSRVFIFDIAFAA